jgi:hypothetical protein
MTRHLERTTEDSEPDAQTVAALGRNARARRVKDSKMRGNWCSGMPMPVSLMVGDNTHV